MNQNLSIQNLKYKNLSPIEIQKLKDVGILNGCGPQSWKGKGPNWLFRACCYHYSYAVGGSEADRRQATGDRRWAD